MTYDSTLLELEKLLSSLERDEIPLEELSEKIEHAFLQLANLRTQLGSVEAKVEAVLNMRGQQLSPDAQTVKGELP